MWGLAADRKFEARKIMTLWKSVRTLTSRYVAEWGKDEYKSNRVDRQI